MSLYDWSLAWLCPWTIGPRSLTMSLYDWSPQPDYVPVGLVPSLTMSLYDWSLAWLCPCTIGPQPDFAFPCKANFWGRIYCILHKRTFLGLLQQYIFYNLKGGSNWLLQVCNESLTQIWSFYLHHTPTRNRVLFLKYSEKQSIPQRTQAEYLFVKYQSKSQSSRLQWVYEE